MENLEVIHYLAETQTIADRETLCHNATKAFSLSELESIRLTHFLLIVVVVLGWYGSGCKVPVFFFVLAGEGKRRNEFAE